MNRLELLKLLRNTFSDALLIETHNSLHEYRLPINGSYSHSCFGLRGIIDKMLKLCIIGVNEKNELLRMINVGFSKWIKVKAFGGYWFESSTAIETKIQRLDFINELIKHEIGK